MVSKDLFRAQPTLLGPTVRLEPLTSAVAEDYWLALNDPEVIRLTGTHRHFHRDEVDQWLASRSTCHDRADWAIVSQRTGDFLGEAVVNELDADNDSASYRVWLAGPKTFGRGYGTEATLLVVDHAFRSGLHRLGLEVFEHNPRAARVYQKCGFLVEGRQREALRWGPRRYDIVTMAILRTDPRPVMPAIPIQ